MQCRSCGTVLQAGVMTCPTCGSPTPYNVAGPVAQGPSTPAGYGSASSPQYEPTILAAPPGRSPQYGGPSQYDPTVAVPNYYPPQGPPATAYGTPPYGPPQANPYEAPQQNAYPYSNSYAPPPPPVQAPYSQAPGGFIQQPSQAPRPQRNRTGLIVGIAALVIVLVGAGIFGVLALTGKNNQSHNSPTATSAVPTDTPTAAPTSAPTNSTTQGSSPSGLPIDSTASSIMTNPQTASAIDSTTTQPTQLSTSFAVQQVIYVTFSLQLNGQTGYAESKWYDNGQLAFTSSILNINNSTAPGGYFSGKYNIATQDGAVELYWCTQSDCSDAALAGVVNFTVS